MDAYKTINDTLVHLFNEIWEDTLVHLFNEIWELEEKAIITEEFKDITNNDMHIIEAIGLGEESTMSAVARTLGITAGSLTTSMNSLVNKKYVTRQRSETDRRVVYIQLTGKGKKAYEHHKNFHMQMTNALVNKKYVTRQRSETDRRVVYIQLTGKGKKAYEHHKNFHMQMTNAVIEDLDEKELAILSQTLDKLTVFFRGYQEKNADF